MRLFVALEIPEAVRASLIELAGELRKICPHARWVRLEGAHITLKFIGEVPSAQVSEIRAALGIPRESREFHPHITLARLDAAAETAALHSAIARRSPAEFGRSRANEFFLYQSILKPMGAEYTRLAVYPLGGEQAP